jgi:hypothetical protein
MHRYLLPRAPPLRKRRAILCISKNDCVARPILGNLAAPLGIRVLCLSRVWAKRHHGAGCPREIAGDAVALRYRGASLQLQPYPFPGHDYKGSGPVIGVPARGPPVADRCVKLRRLVNANRPSQMFTGKLGCLYTRMAKEKRVCSQKSGVIDR